MELNMAWSAVTINLLSLLTPILNVENIVNDSSTYQKLTKWSYLGW